MKPQTILLFAKTERRKGLALAETDLPLFRGGLTQRLHEIFYEFELFERGLGVSVFGECFSKAVSEIELLHGIGAAIDHRHQKLSALLAQKAELNRIKRVAYLRKLLNHFLGAWSGGCQRTKHDQPIGIRRFCFCRSGARKKYRKTEQEKSRTGLHNWKFPFRTEQVKRCYKLDYFTIDTCPPIDISTSAAPAGTSTVKLLPPGQRIHI